MNPGTRFSFEYDGRTIEAEVVGVTHRDYGVTFPRVEDFSTDGDPSIYVYPSADVGTWRMWWGDGWEAADEGYGPSLDNPAVTVITGPDRDRILAACAANADPEGFEWWPRVFAESNSGNISVHLDAGTRIYVSDSVGVCQRYFVKNPEHEVRLGLTEIDSTDPRFAPAVERARAWVEGQKKGADPYPHYYGSIDGTVVVRFNAPASGKWFDVEIGAWSDESDSERYHIESADYTRITEPEARAIMAEWKTKPEGVAAVYGKWPGDESDEQIQAALKSMDGTVPTSSPSPAEPPAKVTVPAPELRDREQVVADAIRCWNACPLPASFRESCLAILDARDAEWRAYLKQLGTKEPPQ